LAEGQQTFALAQSQTGAARVLAFRRVMELVDRLVELYDRRTQPCCLVARHHCGLFFEHLHGRGCNLRGLLSIVMVSPMVMVVAMMVAPMIMTPMIMTPMMLKDVVVAIVVIMLVMMPSMISVLHCLHHTRRRLDAAGC